MHISHLISQWPWLSTKLLAEKGGNSLDFPSPRYRVSHPLGLKVLDDVMGCQGFPEDLLCAMPLGPLATLPRLRALRSVGPSPSQLWQDRPGKVDLSNWELEEGKVK